MLIVPCTPLYCSAVLVTAWRQASAPKPDCCSSCLLLDALRPPLSVQAKARSFEGKKKTLLALPRHCLGIMKSSNSPEFGCSSTIESLFVYWDFRERGRLLLRRGSYQRDVGQKTVETWGSGLLAPQLWWSWRRTGTKDLSALNVLSRVRGSDLGVRRESVASKKEL
jgi:hypothetical protein